MRPVPPPRQRRALVGAALLGLLVLPACTGGAPGPRGAAEESAEQTGGGVRGAAATATRSAELQAGLTALLVERAHLVAGVATADDPRGSATAREALSAASIALADLLGGLYGAAREPLLTALRAEDEALARAVADPADPATADALAQAEAELAVVLRRVVPRLDAAELEQRLASTERVQRAARTDERFPALSAARGEAAATARLLASAVADDRGLPVPSTRGPLLRAALTGLLVEHACLAAALADAHGPGGDPAPARAALEANGRDVARVLGDAYPPLRAPLETAWAAQVVRLDRYAAARAGGGVAVAEVGAVRTFPVELARLLAEHVRGLPAASAGAELAPALDALLVAVDTAAEGAAAAPSALRVAVADALPLAALLAAAVAEDLQLA